MSVCVRLTGAQQGAKAAPQRSSLAWAVRAHPGKAGVRPPPDVRARAGEARALSEGQRGVGIGMGQV